MSNEGTADLCRWLRDNSSGAYRNLVVAAVVIESQHSELIERQSEIDRLTRELAEAKALALPDGWVAVPESVLTALRWYASDPYVWVSHGPEGNEELRKAESSPYLNRIADDRRGHPQFVPNEVRAEEALREMEDMLSARPELPKESSDAE